MVGSWNAAWKTGLFKLVKGRKLILQSMPFPTCVLKCPTVRNWAELWASKSNRCTIRIIVILIFWFSLTCLTTVCEQSSMVARLQLPASWTAISRTENVNAVTYMNISLFGLGSAFAYQSYMSFGGARDLYCSCCWLSNETLVLTCS